jgi:nucleoid DNA-binding protein
MRVMPADTINEERWRREIAEPRARDLHDVVAARGHGSALWSVTVYALQFLHDVPLEAELRSQVAAVLRAVPGVTGVEDGELEWLVRGAPSGTALVEAVAPVVDDLAREARMELAQSLPDGEVARLVAVFRDLPTGDAVYLDDLGWFQVLRFDGYEGTNPRTDERIHIAAKALLRFEADGNLVNVLNHRPREDLGDPTHSNQDGVTIHRYEWARRLATLMGEELCARGSLHIAGFGSLRLVDDLVEYDDPPRRSVEKRVRWTTSEALRGAMNG